MFDSNIHLLYEEHKTKRIITSGNASQVAYIITLCRYVQFGVIVKLWSWQLIIRNAITMPYRRGPIIQRLKQSYALDKDSLSTSSFPWLQSHCPSFPIFACKSCAKSCVSRAQTMPWRYHLWLKLTINLVIFSENCDHHDFHLLISRANPAIVSNHDILRH